MNINSKSFLKDELRVICFSEIDYIPYFNSYIKINVL